MPGVQHPDRPRADPGRADDRVARDWPGDPVHLPGRPRRRSCSRSPSRTSTGAARSPSAVSASVRPPARSPSTAHPAHDHAGTTRRSPSPSRRDPGRSHQLQVTANNGQSTVNGLTFHVLAHRCRARSRPEPCSTTSTGHDAASEPNWSGALGALSASTAHPSCLSPTGRCASRVDRLLESPARRLGANQDAYFTFTNLGDRDRLAVRRRPEGRPAGATSGTSPPATRRQVQTPRTAAVVGTAGVDGAGPITRRRSRASPTCSAARAAGRRHRERLQERRHRRLDQRASGLPVASGAWTRRPVASVSSSRVHAHQRRPASTTSAAATRRSRSAAATTPNLYEVGPGKTYATIQAALDAAVSQQRQRPRRRLPGHARPGQPAEQPARRLLREPDHRLAGQAAGRRPGRLPGQHLRARLDHRRRRLRRRHRRWRRTGTTRSAR